MSNPNVQKSMKMERKCGFPKKVFDVFFEWMPKKMEWEKLQNAKMKLHQKRRYVQILLQKKLKNMWFDDSQFTLKKVNTVQFFLHKQCEFAYTQNKYVVLCVQFVSTSVSFKKKLCSKKIFIEQWIHSLIRSQQTDHCSKCNKLPNMLNHL